MKKWLALVPTLLFANSALAAVSLDFFTSKSFTQTNRAFESGQTSWSTWTVEDGVAKTTISNTKFSSGLTVSFDYSEYMAHPTVEVIYGGSCESGSLAAYTYWEGSWTSKGTFKSGQKFMIDADDTKIAFQAQTSKSSDCTVEISSISIGYTDELVVTKALFSTNPDEYTRKEDSIFVTLPFKVDISSLTPTFTGIYDSYTPTTAQDFTQGPVTYTFSDGGSATRKIVLSVSKTPGDTNATMESVFGFCTKKNTKSYTKEYLNSPYEPVTIQDLVKANTYCTEDASIVHPVNSGDTGTITLGLYKWIPDSLKKTMYGRLSQTEKYAGIQIPSLATKTWYVDGEEVSESSGLDLEKTVLKITSENGDPYRYYKFVYKWTEPVNEFETVLLLDTFAVDYFYPRTIYEPETPSDTGSIIYDIPYNATAQSKLFVCGTGEHYNFDGVFRSCEGTYIVKDTNTTVSVTGKISGSSGMYVTLTNGFDRRLYAIQVYKQTKAWPVNQVVALYLHRYIGNEHFSLIAGQQGSSALKYTIPLGTKDYYSDYEINVVNLDPFAYTYYEFGNDELEWESGQTVKITSVAENNQKRILSAIVTYSLAKKDANLRAFFVQVGSANIPGTIDQENKTIHVEVPFEINKKHVSIAFAGPDFSYSEGYEQYGTYDLSDTIEFDFHSADSSTTNIYKVFLTCNPLMYETGDDAIPQVTGVSKSRISWQGNVLVYEGDLNQVQSVAIFDALGKNVYLRQGLDRATLDMGFLKAGSYFVRIQTAGGLLVQKFSTRSGR